MRLRSFLLTTVALVLLSSINVGATEDQRDDMGLYGRKESKDNANNGETTLTSVEMNDETSDNRTDKTQENNSGNRRNGSRDLMLPSNEDIAKVISDDATGDEDTPEELPEPQELKIVRPHLRKRPSYRPLSRPPRPSAPLNRRNVYSDPTRTPLIRPPRRPTEPRRDPTEKECTFFTKTVCLETSDYPHEAIARSLRSNKEMVAALLADYKTQDFDESTENFPVALALENKYENRYENNEIRRRSDLLSPYENVEEGFTCASVIKYARPQLARAASGIWKYIINTGEHSQTLRLEKCSTPQSSCSFISENYRSSCVQVYNYHRLLTWDNKLGLHMDIFKVPTCCSCHVHGYSEIFPPHQRDPPTRNKESFPGTDFATNEEKDEFEDSSKLSYLNKLASVFDSAHAATGSSQKKPVIEATPNRPPFSLSVRPRPKKPSSSSARPFDKLPQQHAPNTRAPGYTGPLVKGSRPSRPNRPPYRRESTIHVEENSDRVNSSSILNRYSQQYDLDMDATSRLQNGGFDDEYQEPQRRINYNYHPIIDFFRPEALSQQSSDTLRSSASDQNDPNSWKPMIAP